MSTNQDPRDGCTKSVYMTFPTMVSPPLRSIAAYLVTISELTRGVELFKNVLPHASHLESRDQSSALLYHDPASNRAS